MAYQNYNYSPLGLQLDTSQWTGSTSPLGYGQLSNTYANPGIDLQSGITNGFQNNAYQSLGFGTDGTYGANVLGGPSTASQGGLMNWAASNSDLLKAGVGLLTGGIGAWNGFQQNKLMKQNLKQQADQYNQQLALAKQSYNSSLNDRQAARVASNPTAYESVDSYMKKYGAK